MLTVELLNHHNIKPVGIIFCGREVKASREFILRNTQLPLLASIPFFESITRETIKDFAGQIARDLKEKML
jgi:dethiobiotin synthetase